jgi:anthranilate phosphoribosyltransferase
MIKDAIHTVAERSDLTEQQAEAVMGEIMDGAATSAQIAAYLMGLRMKGETVEEIAGSVQAMRARATKIRVRDSQVVDTCGTGGDRAHTFNISTTAAFVVAGAGLTVAKHGNRSVSSKSGSADVLAALGVAIDLPPDRVADCVNEVGIGFLFAPLYHSAMKHCAQPRQELGIRTMLNILGPLTNPAGARIQVVGVFDAGLTEVLAKVLLHLGAQHCFVVHGMDGLDEITVTDRTRISEGKAGVVSSYTIDPTEFGPHARQAERVGRWDCGGQCRHHARYFPGTERAEARHCVSERRAGVRGRAQGEDVAGRVSTGSADHRLGCGDGETGTAHRIYQEGLVTL